MSERLIDPPGLNTPGEDAAWKALQERVVISLRPIGAPTSIGFFGLAAASLALTGLQLGWVPEVEGKHLALALTWLVVGLVLYTSAPGTTSLTAAMSKRVPAAVFLLASIRFFLTGGYHLTGGAGWKVAAGYVGILLFGLAVYAAWAAELEDALGRALLPLGRRGKGKVAVSGSLLEQVKEVTTEPGVRQQL